MFLKHQRLAFVGGRWNQLWSTGWNLKKWPLRKGETSSKTTIFEKSMLDIEGGGDYTIHLYIYIYGDDYQLVLHSASCHWSHSKFHQVISTRGFSESQESGINGVVLAYGILPTCHLGWLAPPSHEAFVTSCMFALIFLGSGESHQSSRFLSFSTTSWERGNNTQHIAGVTQLQLTHKRPELGGIIAFPIKFPSPTLLATRDLFFRWPQLTGPTTVLPMVLASKWLHP